MERLHSGSELCHCFVLQHSVIKLSSILYSMRNDMYLLCLVFCFKAGEDEADNPLQSDDMLTPSVL